VASLGPNFPGAASSVADAGTSEDGGAWVTPSNIFANDGANSTTSLTPAEFSEKLTAQSFGFTVPGGATIDGILVEIERADTTANLLAVDFRVQLLDASGALVGTNKKDGVTVWPAAMAVASYGGASDTWGASPTDGMVNDVDFGVVVSVDTTGGAAATPEVDFIRMTVFYTAAAPPPPGFSPGPYESRDQVPGLSRVKYRGRR